MARTPHHGSAALALGVVVVLLLAGCGDGDTEDPGPRAQVTTSTTSASTTSSDVSDSTTSTPSTPEEQVKAAYVDAIRRLNDGLRTPEMGVDRLRPYFGDAALSRIEARMDALVSAGHRVRMADSGEPRLEVSGIKVREGAASLSACFVDDLVELDARSGVVTSAEARSFRLEVELSSQDGHWRVDRMDSIDDWPDALGCDR